MLSLSVGPAKIVEGWREACDSMMPPEMLAGLKPCFDMVEYWKGDSGAKLYHRAMARLADSPLTLVHGDVNPGNIWKTTLGKTGNDKYCFADWQVTRLAPPAWEFTTPQIGHVPGLASLVDSMKAYHAELCRLDPKIAASYTYAKFEEHVKACTVAFWLFIWAFVHASAVVPTLSGEMPEDKKEYTWQKFMPGVLGLMGAATTELDMIKFQEELLAESPCAAERELIV